MKRVYQYPFEGHQGHYGDRNPIILILFFFYAPFAPTSVRNEKTLTNPIT